uniref:Uncharacterized protein n=1 Tax=Physcomitrium patens TaxID=3218 RepID=A0A7I3ZEM7_PHYPA
MLAHFLPSDHGNLSAGSCFKSNRELLQHQHTYKFYLIEVMLFLLRLTKNEVLENLPPKIIQDRYCDLSPSR